MSNHTKVVVAASFQQQPPPLAASAGGSNDSSSNDVNISYLPFKQNEMNRVITSSPPIQVNTLPSLTSDPSHIIIMDANYDNVIDLNNNNTTTTAAVGVDTTITTTTGQPLAKESEEEEDKHKIQINDWEVNKKEKKKWYLGIKTQRFPSNYISTTKVCLSIFHYSPHIFE